MKIAEDINAVQYDNIVKEIYAKHIQSMRKFYKRATKTMFVCAMINLICVCAIIFTWIHHQTWSPLFSFFAILINLGVCILNLNQSHKYAKLAKAYSESERTRNET